MLIIIFGGKKPSGAHDSIGLWHTNVPVGSVCADLASWLAERVSHA